MNDKITEPRCPYFRKCGGCAFQDVDYASQLENKRRRLCETIHHEVDSVHSGPEYHYRSRMDMVFHPKGLGFREKGSWRHIVDIEQCVISNQKLNDLIREIRDFFTEIDAFDSRTHIGTFRYAVMRTPPQDSSVSIILNQDSPKQDSATALIERFARSTSAANVVLTRTPPNREVSVSEDYTVVKGLDWIKEDFLGRNFYYPVQGFFQNNHTVAEKIHVFCRERLQSYDTAGAHLLDLYGGVGPFAVINADLFRSVTLIESYAPAVLAAATNFNHNQIENARTLSLNAKQLKTIELPQPLVVILDPPRSGTHPKAINYLNTIRPELILYISCNIKQLAMDLEKLTHYSIRSASMFDLFPQTPHMEAVIELVPKEL